MTKKIKPNDKCTCGSDKKFKKCCWGKPFYGPKQEFPDREYVSGMSIIGMANYLSSSSRMNGFYNYTNGSEL
jgi:hypothetical protein